MAHPGGRPTLYRPEYCQDIVEFFHDRLVAYENRPEALQDPDRSGHRPHIWFPTFARYAVKLGVCEDTLKEWAKVHPEFSAAKKEAKAIQHSILVQCGMEGEFENSVAIFTMKNIMKWTDKTNVQVEKKETPEIPTGKLEGEELATYKRLRAKLYGGPVDEE